MCICIYNIHINELLGKNTPSFFTLVTHTYNCIYVFNIYICMYLHVQIYTRSVYVYMYRHTYRQQQMETYEYSLRFLFNTYIHMYIDPQMTHIQIYVCMDMCTIHTHI